MKTLQVERRRLWWSCSHRGISEQMPFLLLSAFFLASSSLSLFSSLSNCAENAEIAVKSLRTRFRGSELAWTSKIVDVLKPGVDWVEIIGPSIWLLFTFSFLLTLSVSDLWIELEFDISPNVPGPLSLIAATQGRVSLTCLIYWLWYGPSDLAEPPPTEGWASLRTLGAWALADALVLVGPARDTRMSTSEDLGVDLLVVLLLFCLTEISGWALFCLWKLFLSPTFFWLTTLGILWERMLRPWFGCERVILETLLSLAFSLGLPLFTLFTISLSLGDFLNNTFLSLFTLIFGSRLVFKEDSPSSEEISLALRRVRYLKLLYESSIHHQSPGSELVGTLASLLIVTDSGPPPESMPLQASLPVSPDSGLPSEPLTLQASLLGDTVLVLLPELTCLLFKSCIEFSLVNFIVCFISLCSSSNLLQTVYESSWNSESRK